MNEKEKTEAIPVVTPNGKYRTAKRNTVITYPGTTDAVFYNLLMRKNICARIISLLTGKETSPSEIEYMPNEFKDVEVRNIYMDIRFIIPGTDVNLEMQKSLSFGDMDKKPGERLMERLIAHAGKMICDSSKKGEKSYMSRKVYVVCFLEEGYNNIKDWHRDYQFSDLSSGEAYDYAKISVIFLKNRDKAPGCIRKWLDLLMTINPVEFIGGDEAMDEAVDVIYTFNSDEELKAYMDSRFEQAQAIRVEEAAMKAAYEEAIEEQKKQIAAAALELQTAHVEKEETIRAFYSDGISKERLSERFHISMEEINRILGL